MPKIPEIREPISSIQPTVLQRNEIAGTNIEIGGKDLKGFFSLLQNDVNLAIIGDKNTSYNCIAWSLGITNNWINPPLHEKVISFYKEQGFKLSSVGGSNRKIAVWFDENGNVMHAARRMLVNINGSSVMCWTSKLGKYYCISHSLEGVSGDTYGAPGMYFE